MTRWILSIAQVILGITILLQALFFGPRPPGGDRTALFILILEHRNLNILAYGVAFTATGVFSVLAAFFFLAGAIRLIRSENQRGIWHCIDGAICYWAYIASHLAMISALPPYSERMWGIRDTFLESLSDPLSRLDYVIGIPAALVAVAVYSYGKARPLPRP